MKQNDAWSLTGIAISQEPMNGFPNFKLLAEAKDMLQLLAQADILKSILKVRPISAEPFCRVLP